MLLVEDDGDVRALVAESLRNQGYDVREAADGREALTAISLERPSLVITDCSMPNMTGNELVAHLAGDQQLSTIPTILISAVLQPAMPSNVLVFLRKPFSIAQLRAAVRGCLE